MTISAMTQHATAGALSPELQASAKRVATYLIENTGAWACYLAVSDRPGHTPRLLVAVSLTDATPSWREIDGSTHTRLICKSHTLRQLRTNRGPALGLPLLSGEQVVGCALLLFAEDALIDTERAASAANLAAEAINLARQMVALHLRAEEIEERTRLREIQVSRNLIRGVIDSVPMGLVLLDDEGVILAANRALSDRFGREPAALVGTLYGGSLGAWNESSAAKTFASRTSERVRRTTTEPDGKHVLVEIVSIPLFDPAGQPHQVVEVWEDITERVSLQTQLVRAEKLAAIGHLAASIAHEVGNPLQAIQGFLALFLEQCPPDTPNQHFLRLAEEEIERIVHVLARLRDLYRPRADVITPVNLNELIDGVLLLTGKQLERNRIRVLHELDPALPMINGVADQLKQVLLNMVLNAAEAMWEGGLLNIQTYVQRHLGSRRAAVIAITDIGVGIPQEQLPHIFDGLHTTKERGMGLGLYTSKAIVERHMGRVWVESVAGNGTTFTISLPIVDEEQSA